MGRTGILASGWQVAPIMQIKSAQFYTVTSGTDRALTVAPGQTPNLVNLNPYPGNQTVTQWVNPAAFATSSTTRRSATTRSHMASKGSFPCSDATRPTVQPL